MAVTVIAQGSAKTVVAATHQAGNPPTNATDGFKAAADGGLVRTFLKIDGSVTDLNVRLYTRPEGPGTDWYAGACTDDFGDLLRSDGVLVNQSREWPIGEGVEFTFRVERISPGTSGNTVAIKAAGVSG